MSTLEKNCNIVGSKTTPGTFSSGESVNLASGKKVHTPEQLDLWARQKALKGVSNTFRDLGDHVSKPQNDVVLLETETFRPDGSEIVLKIVQDKTGDPQQMVMREEGTYLWEYIVAQPYVVEMRKSIARMVKEASSEKCRYSFDGTTIFAHGDKENIVKMKWGLLGILNKIYEPVE